MLLSISADLRAADDAIAFEGPIDPTMPFNNFTSGAGALGTSPPTGRGPSETGVASVAIKQLTMTKKYWYVCATHTGPSSSLQRDDGAGASLMLKLMLVLMFTSPTAHPPPRTSHRAPPTAHTLDNTPHRTTQGSSRSLPGTRPASTLRVQVGGWCGRIPKAGLH